MSPGRTDRKPWLMPIARRYVRRRLRRSFDGVFVDGLADARAQASAAPLIIAANHVCFWDPLVAIQLDAALGTQGHCLMDEDNLRRYPFFAWVGALPLARGAGRRTLAQLRFASGQLSGAGRALWIFPQGRQRQAHLWPHQLSPGVSWLSRKSGARVLPLALSYAYREAAQPSVVASFGPIIEPAAPALLGQLEAAWIAALARIDRFLDRAEGQFSELVPGRSAPARSVPLAGRLLARLARAFAPPPRLSERRSDPS